VKLSAVSDVAIEAMTVDVWLKLQEVGWPARAAASLDLRADVAIIVERRSRQHWSLDAIAAHLHKLYGPAVLGAATPYLTREKRHHGRVARWKGTRNEKHARETRAPRAHCARGPDPDGQ
jgi:hypothetical protein